MAEFRFSSRTSQSIKLLLIENGSYSNPDCFFFSRCSRKLLNGSGGAGDSGGESPFGSASGGWGVDSEDR
jgi:hypothetical protein